MHPHIGLAQNFRILQAECQRFVSGARWIGGRLVVHFRTAWDISAPVLSATAQKVTALATTLMIIAFRLAYDGLICANVIGGAVVTISLAAHAVNIAAKISLISRITAASLAIFSSILTVVNFSILATPFEERDVAAFKIVLYSPFLLLGTFFIPADLEPIAP